MDDRDTGSAAEDDTNICTVSDCPGVLKVEEYPKISFNHQHKGSQIVK